jgi:dolichyl-phosphate beta-glucosyltransferase
VRTGIRCARGRVVLMCDADMSTPPEEIDRLLAPICRGQSDIVVGSRAVDASRVRRSRRRAFVSNVFRRLRELVVPLGIVDTQCGFKAFSRGAALAVFRDQRIDGFAFDCEVLLIARRQGWRVREEPVGWEERGGSTVTIRSALRMAFDLCRLRARDLSGALVRTALAPC